MSSETSEQTATQTVEGFDGVISSKIGATQSLVSLLTPS